MAGLEVVVRPFVFPDIRPRPRQSLPPQDDPEKGFAKIDGQPARQVSLSYSESVSSSKSSPKEVERRVDEVRVYQEEDDGTINRDNFVDLEVPNKITMEEPFADVSRPGSVGGGPLPTPDPLAPGVMKDYYYQRVDETQANIEVTNRDVIKKADEAQ